MVINLKLFKKITFFFIIICFGHCAHCNLPGWHFRNQLGAILYTYKYFGCKLLDVYVFLGRMSANLVCKEQRP